ncbi:MAG: pitrilysin family protein [Thermoanaerobaculia bacterium]
MSPPRPTPSALPDRSRPPAPGRESAVPMPAFDRFATARGVPVFVAPRTGVPLVELELLLDAGGEHNPESLPGLAAMTASMIDEGTARRSGPQLAAELERRGGTLSCSADWNAARLSLQLLAGDLEYGLNLLAELLYEPAFPQHELDRLRQQTLAELQRRADQPASVADETFAHHLYAGTVFAHPLAGTPAALDGMSRDALLEFHQARYHPARGAIAVAGDFDRTRLTAAIEAAFAVSAPTHSHIRSALPASAAADGPDGPPAGPTGDGAADRALRVVVVDRPGAEQTELRIGHLGVPRRHPDRVGLGILNTLLGGKFTSRINLNLRERHGFTYGASSRFVDRKTRGPFVVATAVSTAATGRATAEVLGELRRIRVEAVAPAELEETRNYLLGVFPYSLQTIEGLAARLGEIALYGLPLDTPARYLAEVAAIRPEDLARLAQAHLRPEEALVVAVGPAAELMSQLREIAEPELWQPSRPA